MAFVAVPGIPTSGLTDGEVRMLAALKQNIEQLTGQSGEAEYRAALTGYFSNVNTLGDLNALSVGIQGQKYVIQNVEVAPASEVIALAETVGKLIADVHLLKDVINTIIVQGQG